MIKGGAVGLCLVVVGLGGCAQIDALEKHGLELREARLARERGTATAAGQHQPHTGSLELCDKFQIASPLDVDTAYVRAMDRFKFGSPETIQRDVNARRDLLMAPGLRHDKTPGVLYVISMGTTITTADGSRISPRYSMSIAKDGPSKSKITGDYCYSPNAYNRSQVGDIRPELNSMLKDTFAR
jgi:hypothetical protein